MKDKKQKTEISRQVLQQMEVASDGPEDFPGEERVDQKEASVGIVRRAEWECERRS